MRKLLLGFHNNKNNKLLILTFNDTKYMFNSLCTDTAINSNLINWFLLFSSTGISSKNIW